MPSLTVALVGDPAHPGEGIPLGGNQEAYLRPYRDLATIVVDADERETIASVLERALTRFRVAEVHGQPFFPSWIAFYKPEDEEQFPGHRDTTVILVDEADGAIWNVPFGDPSVTIAALQRSARADALDGDPLRPYLILEAGYGNGLFFGFEEVVWTYIIVREVLGTMADAHGATQAGRSIARSVKRLLQRVRRLPDVLERNRRSWSDHRAAPHDVLGLIDRQAWNSDVLASLLRCSREDAEELLRSRGFIYDDRRSSGYRSTGRI